MCCWSQADLYNVCSAAQGEYYWALMVVLSTLACTILGNSMDRPLKWITEPCLCFKGINFHLDCLLSNIWNLLYFTNAGQGWERFWIYILKRRFVNLMTLLYSDAVATASDSGTMGGCYGANDRAWQRPEVICYVTALSVIRTVMKNCARLCQYAHKHLMGHKWALYESHIGLYRWRKLQISKASL